MSIRIHVSVIVCRDDRILLVQESKPDNYGKWNLPGGHLELGETITQGMRREVFEETGLEVEPCALLGIYTGFWEPNGHAIRFVSIATTDGEAVAGAPEILAVRWIAPKELPGMEDAELVGVETLRRIVADLRSGQSHPIDVLVESERVLSGQ